jgi:acetone carboxylase gamma subunit
MNQLFVCPECKSIHEEPAEASYVLTVLCLDCEIESRYREVLLEPAILAAA